MDAKGNTQICLSPYVDDASSPEGADSQPSFLIVVDGGLPGTLFQLGDSGGGLGRSAENSIQLIDSTISRHHARLSVDINGNIGLTDLKSTNGTYLNGQRLLPDSPVWVRNGDRIRVGKSIVLKMVKLDPLDERFQRELFERMVRDPLTGLFNRGYFLEQIGPLEGKSLESGLGLAVMLADIDHFKKINDTYGHDAGDVVLRDIAQLLREWTRSDDLVARYGGEEFVIAIPVTASEQAYERAERIRQQVGERRVYFRDHELSVTVSLGIACRQSSSERSPTSLITDADDALYHAKRSGRNRVILRPESLGTSHSGTRPLETCHGPFSFAS